MMLATGWSLGTGKRHSGTQLLAKLLAFFADKATESEGFDNTWFPLVWRHFRSCWPSLKDNRRFTYSFVSSSVKHTTS